MSSLSKYGVETICLLAALNAACARSSHVVAAAPAASANAKPKTERAGVERSHAAEPQHMTVRELFERIRNESTELLVYDANFRERYEKGHVPGARWVKYDQVNVGALPRDKNAALVFYCANPQCSAAGMAAGQAMSMGYAHVSIMPDGIAGWEKANFPTEVAEPVPLVQGK